jgi:hypothetical protein
VGSQRVKRGKSKKFYSFSCIELRESGVENQELFSPQSRMSALLRERICSRNAMKKQNTIFTFFSVSSVFSVAKNTHLLCGYTVNQKELIMRNEPNFQKSQMFITTIKTMDYSEKCNLDTWSKQTQSNPIYGEPVEPTNPNFLPISASSALSVAKEWIPAYAGMTIFATSKHTRGRVEDVIGDTGLPATPRKAHTK